MKIFLKIIITLDKFYLKKFINPFSLNPLSDERIFREESSFCGLL